MKKVKILFTLVLIFAVLFTTYRLFRGWVAEEVYRDRLSQFNQDFQDLQKTYNDAVRKTAVTELHVENGKLEVVVVSIAGELERIKTPYNPADEIHVDYVVVDGRLWIRRIHDSTTPATEAMQVDPKLANVDWDDDGKTYGLSIYRPLSEGRWVVSTTANGALALVRKTTNSPTKLVSAPEIRRFEEVEREINDEIVSIEFIDVYKAVKGMSIKFLKTL